jgi:hypothetical protein
LKAQEVKSQFFVDEGSFLILGDALVHFATENSRRALALMTLGRKLEPRFHERVVCKVIQEAECSVLIFQAEQLGDQPDDALLLRNAPETGLIRGKFPHPHL